VEITRASLAGKEEERKKKIFIYPMESNPGLVWAMQVKRPLLKKKKPLEKTVFNYSFPHQIMIGTYRRKNRLKGRTIEKIL